MKILHTADWHLGSRLGRVNRSEDLRLAVERILDYCERDNIDVLLIAGDLFDNVCRSDDVCDAIDHLKEVVRPFLGRGGTILTTTGNHDGETFCKTLRHTLALADPSPTRPGDRLAPGRFHLVTRPASYRLADRSGQDVQFVLMPYPLASRYLDDSVTGYRGGAEGKNRRLREAFSETLGRIRNHSSFDPRLHSVLVAHLYLAGATLPNGHEIADDHEGSDVVLPPEDLAAGWAYVALGHVHKPQAIKGLPHVRYSGSIERLRFDERHDEKGVVRLEIGPEGRIGEPAWLPLEATPFLDVVIRDPVAELPLLESTYPDAAKALVRCQVLYRPGTIDRDEIHRRLDDVFPRCYSRAIVDLSRADSDQGPELSAEISPLGFRETVLNYLLGRLETEKGIEPAFAQAVRAEAEGLIAEVKP